jgi:hypothetical protein
VGRYGTAVRLGALLLMAGTLVAGIYARRQEDGPTDRIAGLTGQRQRIDFRVQADGRPDGFVATIFSQCPTDAERPGTWSPADNAPVPFVWHGRRLTVRESKTFAYGDGSTGVARNTMQATTAHGRIEGSMRSVWRFAREGNEYLVCDRGYVPFTAGDSFSDHLSRVGPVRRPWTLYPARPDPHRSLSPSRWLFAKRVDRTCLRTYRNLQDASDEAARRWQDAPDGRVLAEGVYVQYHAAQLTAIAQLGDAPADRSTYSAWLGNFGRRVALERRQLVLLRRRDLAGAAALEARLATLKARGNAAGIAFGLVTCVSTGPQGAPKS